MIPSADREVSIFGEALELPSSERAAYLDRACEGDSALRQRIEAMLGAQGEAGALFERLERETGASQRRQIERPGTQIDRYLLHEQIGEGGSGMVYRAEQVKPIQRQVALKIIKLGMDTKEVVARFEAERQALALMDHPHIAQVLDAGATEAGRPYFVMELVRGTKITEFCDQHRLSISERLELFVQVSKAVQHAHYKGVIHRDIKPSNILVSMQDDVAFPKLIDFGIAKAIQGPLSDRTVFTVAEQFIGTPAYMSPEQADRGGLDIDTRSDIYSLGVLLYELLTGCTPFDSKTLLASGLDAMRRTIREKEPARPSARLEGLGADELATAAETRGADSAALVRAVRGDLDWIVIKALQKERSIRYATVSALVNDIERHRAGEPISASSPSQWDRLRRIVRKNKLAASAAAAVVVSLALGLGVSTWLFMREREVRHLAQTSVKKQEQLRIGAEKEVIKSREIAQSLLKLLQRLGPDTTSDRTELNEILDRVSLVDWPVQEKATLLRTRAYLRGSAGRFEDACTDFKQLLELTPEDSQVSHWQTAALLQLQRYDEYREHCHKSLERFKDSKGPVTCERIAKDSLMIAGADLNMDVIDAMLQKSLSAGPQHPDIGWFRLAKAMAEYRKGNYDVALDWAHRIDPGKNLALDSQTLLVTAMAASRANRPDEAAAAFEQAGKVIQTWVPLVADGVVDPGWVDRALTGVLQQEARAVLRGDDPKNQIFRVKKD